MSTRKLYYEDSHLAAFTARVLSCRETEQGFAVLLDATAFYPEGGGQAADTGTLNGVPVLDTREQGEEVLHLCAGPLAPGSEVTGRIDYAARFLRMQQHSGEHIVSGILNRRYGCHNTGFHMGAAAVTIDFDRPIPPEDLPDIEAEANAALWADLPIRCWYPSPQELPQVEYRSKRALPWPVRIVEVPGFDRCACCGTHVARTGEIGIIKLFSVIPFRGGARIEMACGSRALEILNGVWAQNKLVSQAFSVPPEQTGAAARRMNELLAEQKYRIAGLEKQVFAAAAQGYAGAGNVVHFQENLEGGALRELADAIAQVCGGIAAVFSPGQGSCGYCLIAREGDLRPLGKALTAALNGRGGGKPNCQQGRLSATEAEIRAFLASAL